jgi:hypothetical protein
MSWVLAYLLTGFVLNWIAVQIFRAPVASNWRIELMATILFPIAIICGVISRKRPSPPNSEDAG